jgi:Xaa-Pro aminopeptidase
MRVSSRHSKGRAGAATTENLKSRQGPAARNGTGMSKAARQDKAAEVLLFADSESNADMLYFGGVFVPDPFIAFSDRGRRVAVVSQLEFARVKKEGRFDEVLPLEEWLDKARAAEGGQARYPASVIRQLGRARRIKGFRVAGDFPCGTAFALRESGIVLEVSEGALFPAREFKDDAEAAHIRAGNAASAAGFRVVEKLLRQAEVRRGWLYHGGRLLTSERVQEAIAVACLGHGAVAANPIVAGGDQACDPHCRGSGPLRAAEFIIVDIFPRVAKTGYHGDMTRTYLKGRPSEAQRALYHAVFEAEQWALGEHRAGKSAARIHQGVVKRFSDAGYPTRRDDGVPVGFIHGLGHGLGLAVHEPPRVNAAGARLRKGQVITVEPGLYYPGLGGVRVEDVVRVTAGEPELLSRHGYRWHIR